METFEQLLSGGNLRSIGKSNSVVLIVKNQGEFDELFKLLFYADRLVVMRAADAIEKITVRHPEYLDKYKKELIELFDIAKNKELKWHLPLLISRIHLDDKEFGQVWNTLINWARDKTNSRIVRVNSVQSLFEMTKYNGSQIKKEFCLTLHELEKENIPSINARIKKISKNTAVNHR